MIEVSEKVIRETAKIMGQASAAAKALAEANRRRLDGKEVRFLIDGPTILVCTKEPQ